MDDIIKKNLKKIKLKLVTTGHFSVITVKHQRGEYNLWAVISGITKNSNIPFEMFAAFTFASQINDDMFNEIMNRMKISYLRNESDE